MVGKVSSEFKEAFGRLLVLLTTTPTIESSLKYSEVLIIFTKAGLITEGKFNDDLKKMFVLAEQSYKNALACYKIQGRPGYMKEQIMMHCFDINYYILPIALSEGILILNQDSFNLTQMFNATEVNE